MTAQNPEPAEGLFDQLQAEAAALIQERHRHHLRPGEQVSTEVTSFRDARRVALRVHDQSSGELLELFVDVPDLPDPTAVDLGLDFLEGVLAEILASDREAYPPLDPAPYEYDGHTVYLSGGVRRPDLEAAADEILNAANR